MAQGQEHGAYCQAAWQDLWLHSAIKLLGGRVHIGGWDSSSAWRLGTLDGPSAVSASTASPQMSLMGNWTSFMAWSGSSVDVMPLVPSASCLCGWVLVCGELFRKNQGLAYREGCYVKVRRR